MRLIGRTLLCQRSAAPPADAALKLCNSLPRQLFWQATPSMIIGDVAGSVATSRLSGSGDCPSGSLYSSLRALRGVSGPRRAMK